MEPKFKIGDEVVRIKGEWNLMKMGDISIVDGVKPYNRGFSVHLERDKPETFHSGSNLQLVSETDMVDLKAEVERLKENKENAVLKREIIKKQKDDKFSEDQGDSNPEEDDKEVLSEQ